MSIKVEIHKIDLPALPEWNVEEITGYKPFTSFWNGFSIADLYGVEAVKDTYKRAFAEWKSDYKYLTELVMVLNWKTWQHNDKRPDLAEVYENLYYKTDNYALDNLKGEEQTYYWQVTD